VGLSRVPKVTLTGYVKSRIALLSAPGILSSFAVGGSTNAIPVVRTADQGSMLFDWRQRSRP
jgi:ribosome-interacting GTPase 1